MNAADWMLLWTAATAVATILGALAAAAAAVAAVVTLRALRQDSTDRTRPVVIADFHRNPLIDHHLDLRIRNVGATPATQLRVRLSPDPLVDPSDKRDRRHSDAITRRYAQTIPLLAAGATLSNGYWRVDPQNDGTNVYPLPDQVEVTITYSDLRGHHVYSDSFELDVATLAWETYCRPAGSKFEKRTADTLEAIARGVGSA